MRTGEPAPPSTQHQADSSPLRRLVRWAVGTPAPPVEDTLLISGDTTSTGFPPDDVGIPHPASPGAPVAARQRVVLPDWRGIAVIFLLTVVAAASSIVTPAGEAPDEPAHVEYIDTLLSTQRLPSPVSRGIWAYESHQPPLDYLVSAVLSLAVNGGSMQPRLRYRQPGDPASAARTFIGDAHGAVRVHRLRLARLAVWLPALLWLIFVVCRTAGVSPGGAIAALVVIGGAPQVLWLAGVVVNDLSVSVFCSLTTLALLRLLMGGRRIFLVLLAVGITCALFSKASAVVLVAPVGVTCLILIASKKRRMLVAAASIALSAFAGWIAFNLWRHGNLTPSIPRPQGAGILLSNLYRDPTWPSQVISTFWAKFGWMSVSLPAAWYFLLIPIVTIVLLGVLFGLRSRRHPALIVLALLGMNWVLQAVYLVAFDYQLQGRYLFPSLAAIAVLFGYGIEWLSLKSPRLKMMASTALPALSLLAAIVGVIQLHDAY